MGHRWAPFTRVKIRAGRARICGGSVPNVNRTPRKVECCRGAPAAGLAIEVVQLKNRDEAPQQASDQRAALRPQNGKLSCQPALAITGSSAMPIPFFLVSLLGKAAASALSKGLAAKTAAASAKAYGGHHGRHVLAREVVGKVVESAVDRGMDGAAGRKKGKEKRRSAKQGADG